MNNPLIRAISFLLIITLVLVFPVSLPDSAVNADTNTATNSVDMSKVGGKVTIESNGTVASATTGSGVVFASGPSIIITGKTTEYGIEIPNSSKDVNLILSGASIDVSSIDNKAAIHINNTSKTSITLKNENTLQSGSGRAGIHKDGNADDTGPLEIKGGDDDSLTVTGGAAAAGIGSKPNDSAQNITLIGGNITATGGDGTQGYGGGAGLGSGGTGLHDDSGSASNITISGGILNATGGNADGVYYSGGGAGIGSGGGNFYGTAGSASDITISGGIVSATGGSGGSDFAGAAAGIGTGGGSDDSTAGSASNITISGGTVSAIGGNGGSTFGGGAGIGSGCYSKLMGSPQRGSASNIKISGGTITAEGGNKAAGIGGGDGTTVSGITISGDASVAAIGGNDGAGIGGGNNGDVSVITISGDADVTATGGAFGAGIGGGYSGTANDIIISGGTVIAVGKSGGAGIGGGSQKSASNIIISGGTVTATGDVAAGIGGGDNGKAENITISGGFVTAKGSYARDIGRGSGGPSSTGIRIIGGSVYAVNDDIESPKASNGTTDVYKVTVPALSIPDGLTLKGNKDIMVPLGGTSEYKAKTVNDETVNEHGVGYPDGAAAYIYLPAKTSYSNITVGEYKNGSAEVVPNPTSQNQNIVMGLVDPSIITEYFIKASKSGNGTINPSGNIKVNTGGSKTFSISPYKGYSIKNLLVDGKYVNAASQYAFNNVESDHSITAYFIANKYKLTFNKNKGKKIIGAKSKIVTYDQKIGKLPKAKRTGYKLKGWYTKRSGGKKITASTKMSFTKNTTLYARWTPNAKIANCKYVHLRKGPGVSKFIKTYIKKGTKVSILKTVKVNGHYKWYKVKVGKKTGYIYSKYVKRV